MQASRELATRLGVGAVKASAVAALALLVGCLGSTDPITFPGDGGSGAGGGAGGAPSCASLGRTECGSDCADLYYDQQHCGKCEHPCSAGTKCNAGSCTGCALLGLTDCNGVCTDVNNDDNNCGSCGNVCSGLHCSNGKC